MNDPMSDHLFQLDDLINQYCMRNALNPREVSYMLGAGLMAQAITNRGQANEEGVAQALELAIGSLRNSVNLAMICYGTGEGEP
jgi:fatty acid/phospholipid biosynthesis enzyme